MKVRRTRACDTCVRSLKKRARDRCVWLFEVLVIVFSRKILELAQKCWRAQCDDMVDDSRRIVSDQRSLGITVLPNGEKPGGKGLSRITWPPPP